MAAINIKVKSDFAQASKDLKSFGTVTATEAKRVEAYLKNFKADSIDSFIDKNQRLGVAYKANKGEVASIIVQQKALEKQSISLIAKGLDPQDEAIEKLNDEYNRLQAEYDQTTTKTKDQTKASTLASGAMLALGASAVLLGGKALTALKDFTTESIGAASAAEEVNAKFNTAFSGIETKAAKTALALKESYGLSQTEAENLLGSTGDLVKGFGATASEALNISNGIQELAADLASYNNLQGGATQASAILTKAWLGERESLTTLGIKISEAAVQQRLMEKGQKSLTGQALLLAKGQATMELAIQQSADAMGDFERTQDSYANTMKVAKARTADLQVELGRALLPTATKGIGIFSRLTGKLGDYIKHLNDVKIAEDAQKSGLATKQQELIILKDKLTTEESNLKNQKLSMAATDERLAQAGIIQTQEQKNSSLLGQSIIRRETIINLLERDIGLVESKIKAENDLAEATRIAAEAEAEKALAEETASTAAINLKELNIDSINKIITAHLGEKEVIDNKIIALQEITGLTESQNKKRLDSIKLLQKDKQVILDEESEAKKTFLGEQLDAETAFYEELDQLAKDKKKQEAKDLAEKLAATQDMIESVTGYVDQGISLIESLATKSQLAFSDLGDIASVVGNSISNDIVTSSGKLFSMIANIVTDIIESAEELQQELLDTSNDTYSQMLSNRKALIDETYDLEAERISDTYDLELETIKNTLSEAEILQLQSLGVIAETKAEANETARREALEAAADAGIVAEAQIQAINDVYDAKKTAIEDSETAEATAAAATAQYQYDNAVFQRDLSVAQATINKDKALSELPWYTSSSDRNEVGSNYDSLISSISSAPLPQNPSAQTGTPMGGFQVPENTGNSRADNTSINVSPGENVSVTPRGEGGNSQNIIVQIDRQTLFDVVNDGVESGDIIINTDNIQSA